MKPRHAKIFMACFALIASLHIAQAVHVLMTLPSGAAIEARVAERTEELRSLVEPQNGDFLKVHRVMMVGAEMATREARRGRGVALLISGLTAFALLAFARDQWLRAERATPSAGP